MENIVWLYFLGPKQAFMFGNFLKMYRSIDKKKLSATAHSENSQHLEIFEEK